MPARFPSLSDQFFRALRQGFQRRYSRRRRCAAITSGLISRSTIAAEPLESRLLLTTTFFVDFGGGIGMGNTLSTTAGAFRNVFGPGLNGNGTGSDLNGSAGIVGASSLDFTPLDYDFDLSGTIDNADITALTNAVVPLIERALEPFDIDVVVGAATSFADAVTAVAANNGAAGGKNDAYNFIMDITSDAFGGGSVGDSSVDWISTLDPTDPFLQLISYALPASGIDSQDGESGDNTGLFGIAAADDLFTQMGNRQDEATLTFLDTVFNSTNGTPGTVPFNQNLAYRIAYTATHEAFHTFTYVHTTGTTAGTTLLSSGDVIRLGSVTREDPFMVTRFDLGRQGNFPVAEPNNYLLAANDPDIGLRDSNNNNVPDFAFVTGTGAHDRITLTQGAGTIVNVLVESYLDSARTSLIASESYTIDLLTETDGSILIDGGINSDHIIVDGQIDASFRVRGGTGSDGGPGSDELEVVNAAGTNLPGGPGAGTIMVAGGTQIVYSEIESVTVSDAAIIVDNGDAGFSTVGSWTSKANASARDSDLSHALNGAGAKVARWIVTGLTPGNYQVSATWVAHLNRATNAPFTILDSVGGTTLATTLLNQQAPPSDFMDDGTAWEDLAVVTVTGSTLVVELSNAADGYVIADAIRVTSTETTAAPSPRIIDDNSPGFSKTAGWKVSTQSNGYLVDVTHAPAGDGSRVATWTFDGLAPGNDVVSATWTTNANRATNAPFTVRDGVGGPVLEQIRVNQRLAPNDFTDVGTSWEQLTIVGITGSTLVVELSNDANQYVIADAIHLEPTNLPPLPLGVIVDDGDPEFNTTAGWKTSPLSAGYENDVRNAPSGNGSQVATWTFEGLAPGEYTVAATWTANSNRATNSPFTLYHGVGGPVLGTVNVNQKQAPDDFMTLGSNFENLMTVLVTDGTLVVELSNNANGYVIADAIRVAPAVPSPADPIVIDGNFSDWDSIPTYTDPADDQHDTDHDGAGETPGYVDHPDADLLAYKVTHDNENFYFYFEATGEIGRTQVEDLANGLRAGRYYVIVTIDVDSDDVTGYPLYEGGYYTGTTDTTGYDANAEIEFFNGEFNTGHYLQHGARNAQELEQAFDDQSRGQYLWNGPQTQGPFMPGFVNVLPGTYDFYTQWSFHENNPATTADDQITFVEDKGPVVSGNVNYAHSADNHKLEMKVPFKGFLVDVDGNPIVTIGQFVDLSFSLEASGEFSNEVSPANPHGIWASDTGEPINNYFLRPVS